MGETSPITMVIVVMVDTAEQMILHPPQSLHDDSVRGGPRCSCAAPRRVLRRSSAIRWSSSNFVRSASALRAASNCLRNSSHARGSRLNCSGMELSLTNRTHDRGARPAECTETPLAKT